MMMVLFSPHFTFHAIVKVCAQVTLKSGSDYDSRVYRWIAFGTSLFFELGVSEPAGGFGGLPGFTFTGFGSGQGSIDSASAVESVVATDGPGTSPTDTGSDATKTPNTPDAVSTSSTVDSGLAGTTNGATSGSGNINAAAETRGGTKPSTDGATTVSTASALVHSDSLLSNTVTFPGLPSISSPGVSATNNSTTINNSPMGTSTSATSVSNPTVSPISNTSSHHSIPRAAVIGGFESTQKSCIAGGGRFWTWTRISQENST
ncbi:hypothetical protein C8R44DRAFT_15433 [Mycena epipterygia]|nr:hypothetical protein C8R44DRAFT_15433 [Mycena epipterygia]